MQLFYELLETFNLPGGCVSFRARPSKPLPYSSFHPPSFSGETLVTAQESDLANGAVWEGRSIVSLFIWLWLNRVSTELREGHY